MPRDLTLRFISSALWMTITCSAYLTRMSYISQISIWCVSTVIVCFIVDPEESKRIIIPLIVRELDRLPTGQQQEGVQEVQANLQQHINDVCPISQEEIKVPSRLSCCGKYFEKDSLNTWLRVSKTCPQCRSPVTYIEVMSQETL